MISYNNKVFRAISNSDNGEVDSETLFHYQQEGNILTCTYAGNRILYGHLIATVSPHGELDMRYHQVNNAGEITTGICRSKPEILVSGKIRLHEKWQWTSGDLSAGESVLEEV
ncbi:hypothetical protein DYBT9275_03547 [Dyadobacter sp. CECT 9275]|uniref:N-acetylglutamate synthase n=1 Tax=Dyadobacter helix TaxID=2822344 RepID=A0A916JDL5_9BACT|nr:n-acetylglutamate synthase [Dyadobacter sp. CECT 9275]CAG5005248.1 hypothetical protein DYBT9275_03547 [Dyadobacter sp. CECT 9275]